MLSRTTRILLVLALVSAVAYLVIVRAGRRHSPDDSALLVHFDIHRVDGLILQRPDETLRFARADSLWRMTEPLFDRAEASTILSLLDALEHADIARNLGASDDLKPFGLDPPRMRVIALAGADTLLEVALGKRTVDDAWCYARTRSQDLLLVPTNIARAASLPRDAYRSQRVVDFQLRDVADYMVANDDHAMTWSRGERGWFSVPALDDTVRGDSVAVESVLRRLRGLRVASFVADSDSQRVPVSAGLLMVSLWKTGRAPLASLNLYRRDDGSSVAIDRLSGRAVVVQDGLSDLFEQTTTSLRDRRLLQFSPPDAARIEVVLPGATGAIVRTGGVWSYPNAALGRIDPDHAADFVRALRALKWTGLPAPDAARTLRASRFSVTVTGASGTILDEMRVDPRPDGLWFVTSRSSRGSWMIEGERLTALADRFARLKTP